MVTPEGRDDETIPDDELLWRRVLPSQIVADEETGRLRPSSAAFRPSDSMSVSIASMTSVQVELEKTPEQSLAEFAVGFCRSLGCSVVRQPEPENPAHALVFGGASKGCLTKTQAKQIAHRAQWKHLARP